MAEQGGSSEADAEDRTHDPSEQRLRKAREAGQVPLGREAVQLASLCGGAAALAWLGPSLGHQLVETCRGLFSQTHALSLESVAPDLMGRAAPLVFGCAGLAALAGFAATLVQTRGLINAKALIPKPSKISPHTGIKRLFGPQGLMELARALIKLAACGLAMWWVSGDVIALLPGTLASPPEELAATALALITRLLSYAVAAFAVVAFADFGIVHFKHMKSMRMTLQEVKDEMKESEGDPHFRARRKQIAVSRSRKRMMAEIPKATVIVTNPTHYAVALAYVRGVDAAPRIVARGVDALAARIRAEADKHAIPIIPNPPLARALYKLDDGAQIPAEHFQAVAEIIALVWRMQGNRAA
ncbi:EscU/YscU/HrcU family type III secretion system export apparatus switch protein [Roseomonas sp. USHLN139]|uniref:EscU/YscU/HrcU family type III secretion system export apparatus switch protein n=1 Tax=Roseomonas sp. USHLN139 TaxID=3081298 RepID=UPI003B0124A2